MRYRTLGRTGEKVSEIGFGCAGAGFKNYLHEWNPTSGQNIEMLEAAIHRAIELGINFFDTAPIYGSEALLGGALKDQRHKVFVASKVELSVKSSDEVLKSVDESLKRLNTDYIDLLQYHGDWYTKEHVEALTKSQGILSGMHRLREERVIRFIGLTSEGVNGYISDLIKSDVFDVLQIQYNLFCQHPFDPTKKSGVMYEAENQKMGIAIMRPFTAGVFSKWCRTALKREGDLPDALHNLVEGLLSFVLSNPLTDVAIVGMRSPARVEQNCAICNDLERRIDIDKLYQYFF